MTTHSLAQPRIICTGRVTAGGPIQLRTIQDERTYGRSLYFSGATLEQCTNAAQRAGFVGAEADCRRAERQAMWDISFDEWCANRGEYDREAWEL